MAMNVAPSAKKVILDWLGAEERVVDARHIDPYGTVLALVADYSVPYERFSIFRAFTMSNEYYLSVDAEELTMEEVFSFLLDQIGTCTE